MEPPQVRKRRWRDKAQKSKERGQTMRSYVYIMLIEVLCDPLSQVITIRIRKVLFDIVYKKRVRLGIERKRCYLINIPRQRWFLFCN